MYLCCLHVCVTVSALTDWQPNCFFPPKMVQTDILTSILLMQALKFCLHMCVTVSALTNHSPYLFIFN